MDDPVLAEDYYDYRNDNIEYSYDFFYDGCSLYRYTYDKNWKLISVINLSKT